MKEILKVKMEGYHKSVLLEESVDGLDIKPNGVYVDVTFGGGGHSREILKRLDKGKLIAFDQDADAQKNKIDDERLVLVKANFRYLKSYLRLNGVKEVDGVLADLGVSSHQFDEGIRGFSTRFDARLDMRMDVAGGVTAEQVLADYENADLERLFREYGDLKNTRKIVEAIRGLQEVEKEITVDKLKTSLLKCAPPGRENQFFAKVFQALRIEVNEEMKVLDEMLEQGLEVLKEGGRFVVISYHSLEDRRVKKFFKAGNLKGEVEKDFFGRALTPFKQITRKPIVPNEQEIEENSRARSAKLRIAEKVKIVE